MTHIITSEEATSLYSISPSCNLICIEGHTASGKTNAGNLLAQHLNAHFIDTDSFIDDTKDKDLNYVDQLKLEELLTEIRNNTGKKIIVGICLRDTLSRLKLNECLFFIYIKVISKTSGVWMEEYNLVDFKEGSMDTSNTPKAHLDSYEYTLKYEPQNKADVIFERLS
ncbi:shikimate kinase [Serratia fonticola]|uniref:shikimate kinase n=1 Tax=Serratia fonticola TaxID=47917 RepID=UPI003AB0B6E2